MPWLLKKETADELVALRRELLPHAAAANPRAAYAAAKEDGKVVAGPDAVMAIKGGVAEIKVEGVLTPEPDPCAWFFGIKNTAYSDIIAALAKASADSSVKSILLKVDSPGGNVDGLFDTLAAIQAVQKPMSVLANQACSAAYAIAAAAGEIKATNPAACFGSIGVAVSIRMDPDVVDLTSTEAPDKRPDVTTDEGRAVYVKLLDGIHDLFVESIADARGVESSKVNETFGRGATVLAGEAKRLGMIDHLDRPARLERRSDRSADKNAGSREHSQHASAVGGGQEIESMDINTLKAQHPQLVAELLAEGNAQGTKNERDRVTAHLTMGKQGGSQGLAIAFEAIEKGEGFSLTTNAKYMSVALNERDSRTRQEESNGAGVSVDGAKPVKSTGSVLDAAADAYCGKGQ